MKVRLARLATCQVCYMHKEPKELTVPVASSGTVHMFSPVLPSLLLYNALSYSLFSGSGAPSPDITHGNSHLS